jgi:hypothetical protein
MYLSKSLSRRFESVLAIIACRHILVEARSVGKAMMGNCRYVGFVPANLPVWRCLSLSRSTLDQSAAI